MKLPPQQKHYSRARNSPVVFALANAGARLLVDMGFMEKGRLDWNRNNDAVQHPHIDHELLINTVSICVERGIESTKGAELIMSQRAFANKMRVYVPEQRRSKSFEMDC